MISPAKGLSNKSTDCNGGSIRKKSIYMVFFLQVGSTCSLCVDAMSECACDESQRPKGEDKARRCGFDSFKVQAVNRATRPV